MGLGGYLTWTATAREIRKKYGKNIKLLPVEQHGSLIKYIESEVFKDNDDFCNNLDLSKDYYLLPLVLNNPSANYCKKDTIDKAYHRPDKHIIEQQCEVYGIENPELRCFLNISSNDLQEVKNYINDTIKTDKFITVEPLSKVNYTKNRVYPFDKWQKIVNELSKSITVVQVGLKNSQKLKNTIDATGKFSFKKTARLIGLSKLFMSTEGGLVHANTCFRDSKSLVIVTGYQSEKMIAYPQNINVNISLHGPCGMKKECIDCKKESELHDWKEIVKLAKKELCL